MRPGTSEKAFRRYENVIADIVKAYPNVVELTPPSGLAASTFVARLRDAIASFRSYKWKSSFDEIPEDISVQWTAGGIFVGCAKPTQNLVTCSVKLAGPSGPVLDATHLQKGQTELLCWLSAERALSKPLKLSITDAYSTMLQANFDVLLEKNPDGTYTLT